MDDITFYSIATKLWATANANVGSPEDSIALAQWALEAKRRLDAAQSSPAPTMEANDGGDA